MFQNIGKLNSARRRPEDKVNAARWWLVAIVSLVGQLAVQGADKSPKGEEALRVVAEGYRRNRESFVRMDCSFNYTIGTAATLDDAMRCRFSKTSKLLVRSGEWLVAADKVFYELRCPRDVADRVKTDIDRILHTRQKESRVEHSLECSDIGYLRSVEYSLRYDPFFKTGNLFAKEDPDRVGIRKTPFNLDVMGGDENASPARNVLDCIEGRYIGIVDIPEVVNGANALVIRISQQTGAKLMTYAFDPDRGFLPVRWTYFDADGRARFSSHILETRRCSGGRWFPIRAVVILRPDRPGPYLVSAVEVTSLDVDHEPSDNRFRMPLLKGSQVNIPTRNGWLTKIDRDRIISPSDLSTLYRDCAARAQLSQSRFAAERNAAIGKSAPATAPLKWRSWLIIVNSIFVVAAVFVIIVKLWHRPQ